MRAIYQPESLETRPAPTTIDFGSSSGSRKRSITSFLKELTAEAEASDYLFYSPVGTFTRRRNHYRLARYVFLGPGANDEPIRIGLFAAIHGDEAQTASALVEFLRRLHREPERAHGYQIFVYPICNPSGFEDDTHLSRSGHDLNHEFWQGSYQPEVYYIERELGVLSFHGVVSLHAGAADGVHAHSRSETIGGSLVNPMLKAAERILPRATHLDESDCAAAEATGRSCQEGVLADHSELSSMPFEILFETPAQAPEALQIEATIAALDRLLAEYRPFLAARQNI